ncbi:MAG: protein kinase domain-containing protein, partial [Gemmatimonadales bacterium]
MDLRTQLQQHLGLAYSIDRELGGGGMSRVFAAEETRLGRTVVIKVLTPDLAQGINAERFEREIRLAASLQQANIVPVLAAGDVDGLPYFTMPYVEGESLRHRLSHGTIPVNDVVAILRDVTRALAYAHARGVVHRDIKPDNVLLSGGTAVITDFGIAKAISASRTAAPGATLTQLGTSIGTPAYMAPEQVAGDPHLDHRVDLYSLGCMAHELLTGRQPFADRTPQRALAAHLSEAAPSVAALRTDCPGALASLVTQLMEKDPAHRPQTASEVLQILDTAITTTSRPTLSFSAPGMFRRALLVYAVATAVVLLCAKAAIISIGLPSWVFPGAIVVMALGLPAMLITAYVQRVARQAALATPTLTPGGTMAPRPPTGTVATIAMKARPHITWRRTARGGVLAVISFIVVVAAFMVMRAFGIGPAASLFAAGKLAADDRIVLADFVAAPDDSALVPVAVEAARAGAKAVLGGNIARAGTGYLINLQLRNAMTGATLAAFPGTADGIKDLLKTLDGLTRDLRSKVGESLKLVQNSVPLERATTSSLDALRLYSEATTANDLDSDYELAVRLLRQAVAKDSTFALAWRKLAGALGNAVASPAAVDSALERAARYADKLPDREKYLALGEYYRAHRTHGNRVKALDAYRAAYAADSNSTTAANQLTYSFETRRQWDSMVWYAQRLMAI